MHANPQSVPSHVAIAFGGAGHAVHEAPHVITSMLFAHAPLHE